MNHCLGSDGFYKMNTDNLVQTDLCPPPNDGEHSFSTLTSCPNTAYQHSKDAQQPQSGTVADLSSIQHSLNSTGHNTSEHQLGTISDDNHPRHVLSKVSEYSESNSVTEIYRGNLDGDDPLVEVDSLYVSENHNGLLEGIEYTSKFWSKDSITSNMLGTDEKEANNVSERIQTPPKETSSMDASKFPQSLVKFNNVEDRESLRDDHFCEPDVSAHTGRDLTQRFERVEAIFEMEVGEKDKSLVHSVEKIDNDLRSVSMKTASEQYAIEKANDVVENSFEDCTMKEIEVSVSASNADRFEDLHSLVSNRDPGMPRTNVSSDSDINSSLGDAGVALLATQSVEKISDDNLFKGKVIQDEAVELEANLHGRGRDLVIFVDSPGKEVVDNPLSNDAKSSQLEARDGNKSSSVANSENGTDSVIGDSGLSVQSDHIMNRNTDRVQAERDFRKRAGDNEDLTFQIGSLSDNLEKCTDYEDKASQPSQDHNKITEVSQIHAKVCEVFSKDKNSTPAAPLGDKKDTHSVEIDLHQSTKENTSKSADLKSAILDLNNPISIAGRFHQPFTDLQQVQLRAQIFVYGSLIQGIPPDESCMLSAFGEHDGRTKWESAWRNAFERFQNQKFTSIDAVKASNMHLGFKSLSSPSRPWTFSSHGVNVNMPRILPLDFNQYPSPIYGDQSSKTRTYNSNITHGLPQNSSAVTSRSPGPRPTVRDSSGTATREFSLRSPSGMPLAPQIELSKKLSIPESNTKFPTAHKSRKRIKTVVSETPLPDPTSTATLCASLPSFTTGLCHVSPSGPEKTSNSNVVFSVSSQEAINGSTQQKIIASNYAESRFEQAKQQAEEAAAMAASAIKNSQGIWNQLNIQRNSGLIEEKEHKIASATVAAEAALAVAKAATSAGKVALDAAIQAKMMADETLNSHLQEGSSMISSRALGDKRCLSGLTMLSILEGKDSLPGCISVISAAREAARKRVEAAFAATKRAENVDAIVRAAELTAQALSFAATIITMGDPFPAILSELPVADAIISGESKLGQNDCHGTSKHNSCRHSDKNEVVKIASNEDGKSCMDELPTSSNKANGFQGNAHEGESTYPEGHGTHGSSSLIGMNIEVDSLVEVNPLENDLRGTWFSAKVLDIKDNKACVSYNFLRTEGMQKEWIPLESDGNSSPRIRNAHPIMTIKTEGTRKRSREASRNYVWAVGDRIDAWIRDGWVEGVITEKSKEDETKLTILFLSGGTSIVRAWDLRPSLIWENGQWREQVRSGTDSILPLEDDTPHEKKQKTSGTSDFETSDLHGKGKSNSGTNPLALTAKDVLFSSGRKFSKSDSVKQSNLRKGGMGVIFGVPKPGKRRRFIEVSKHYDAEKMSKTIEGNRTTSIKFAKYLMPQAPRLSRSIPKVESRTKEAVDSNTKFSKPPRSRIIEERKPVKEDNSHSGFVFSNGGKSGVNSDKNKFEKNGPESGSSATVSGHKDDLVQELLVQPLDPESVSKMSSVAETDQEEKTVGDEERGFDDHGRIMLETTEPRRSTRRIRPTSRLLEGLQSSLIISRIPGGSSEKSSRSVRRTGSRDTSTDFATSPPPPLF